MNTTLKYWLENIPFTGLVVSPMELIEIKMIVPQETVNYKANGKKMYDRHSDFQQWF